MNEPASTSNVATSVSPPGVAPVQQSVSGSLLTTFMTMGIVALTVVLMVFGKSILLPLVIAVLVWYIINSLASHIQKLSNKMPHSLSRTLAILILLGGVYLVMDTIVENAEKMASEFPVHASTLSGMYQEAVTKFHVTNKTLLDGMEQVANYAATLAGSFLTGLMSISGLLITVLLYIAFLLAEQNHFAKKIAAIFPHDAARRNFLAALDRIDNGVRSYLWIKTLAGLSAGVFTFILLELMGVQFALFFAMLIFFMNFIPFIGAILGVAFPAIMAFIQFGSFTQPLIIIAAMGTAGFFVGNVLEPKMMGKSMNLSPLTILLALAIFGSIWGIVGMLISVPITVIIMIALSNFPQSRGIAALLSEEGEVYGMKIQ